MAVVRHANSTFEKWFELLTDVLNDPDYLEKLPLDVALIKDGVDARNAYLKNDAEFDLLFQYRFGEDADDQPIPQGFDHGIPHPVLGVMVR